MAKVTNGMIAAIKHLLKQGKLPQRRIAEVVGVSRGTVRFVQDGILDYRQVRIEVREERGVLGRCGECGHLVEMPCRGCRLLPVRRPAAENSAIELELDPADAQRLAEVREQARERQLTPPWNHHTRFDERETGRQYAVKNGSDGLQLEPIGGMT